MRTTLFAAVVCGIAAAGYFLTTISAANPVAPEALVAPVPASPAPDRLVAHEWGTFTSFSGSNGIPARFTPNNEDLPHFVYHQDAPYSKSGRLNLNGLISMETPVVYLRGSRDEGIVTGGFPARVDHRVVPVCLDSTEHEAHEEFVGWPDDPMERATHAR